MNVKPTKNLVLIEIHEIAQSAVVAIDENEFKTEKATVLDIGDDVRSVSVGDVVYFKNYETDTIENGDETYILIPEDAIKLIRIK